MTFLLNIKCNRKLILELLCLFYNLGNLSKNNIIIHFDYYTHELMNQLYSQV